MAQTQEQTQQNYIMQLSILEQQIQQLEQQLQIILQQISELEKLKINLQDLEKGKEDEIFADVGNRIFAKAKILEKDLLVDVGSKTLVKKTPREVQKIIEKQIAELEKIREQTENEFQKLKEQENMLVLEASKKMGKK